MPNYKGPVKQSKKPYYHKDLPSADAEKKYYMDMLEKNIEDAYYKLEGMVTDLEYHKKNNAHFSRPSRRYIHEYNNFRVSGMIQREIRSMKLDSKVGLRLGKNKKIDYDLQYNKNLYFKGKKLNKLYEELIRLRDGVGDISYEQLHTQMDIFEKDLRTIMGEWSEDENTD